MSFSFDDIVKGLNRAYRGTKNELRSAKEKANWVWEALQGDFNPNRSMGQIGTDMVVCLIPGVDTVMDVRDLIANIIAIVRAPASGFAWFSLVLTLVGFIPELGSVVKGVVKIVFVRLRPLIKHAEDLTNASKMVKHLDNAFDEALGDIVTYLRDPQVQRFLTKARIPDVVKFAAKSIRTTADIINPAMLKKLFDKQAKITRAILEMIHPLLPKGASTRIKQLIDGTAFIQREFVKRVDQYMGPLRAMMQRLAQRLDDLYWVAWTQQVNKGWIAPLSERGSRRLIANHQPKWVKTTAHVRYEQYDADTFRRSARYKSGKAASAPELKDGEMASFSNLVSRPVKARALHDGETLYRIVDPTSGAMSASWINQNVWDQIHALPIAERRAFWRSKLAVKPEWNQNGQFIKYTHNRARDGDIVVWEGPTAAQFLDKNKRPEAGYLEGGLDQIQWRPGQQIKGAKGDDFTDPIRAPDMVEGGAMDTRFRRKINDPRMQGPFETGWGYKDFEDQHDLIGLPNPNRE